MILGIVVLYRPDPVETVANIGSYVSMIDRLIVWDNTPAAECPPFDYPLSVETPVDYLRRQTNEGLGEAYNFAARRAIQERYTHLLLMDQDSAFAGDSFNSYLRFVQSVGELCIFSPNYRAGSGSVFPTATDRFAARTTFSSGTLYPVELFQTVGLFQNDYFIDFIDIEYCLRAGALGIPVWVATHVVLCHRLGNRTTKKPLPGISVSASDYPPMRTYYIVRNGIYTYRRYRQAKSSLSLLLWVVKKLAKIVVFDTHKTVMLKAYCRGVADGLRGRLGPHRLYR